MKQQQLLIVLAVLIGAILLGLWMRRSRSEGFADTPECTYAEPKAGFIPFCANNLENPFRCLTFTTLQEAKIACSGNENCRAVVEADLGNRKVYQMRVGPGASTYDNLQTMISEMLTDAGTPEQTYFISNLSQCKPGKFASKIKGPNDPPQIRAPSPLIPSGPAGGAIGIAPESLDVTGPAISVPANTLLAVPASQTIFAKRPAGGPAESSPAPVGPAGSPPIGSSIPPPPNASQQTARRPMTEQEFAALTLTPEERQIITGLPLALQIKVVDAGRNNIAPQEALTPEELNLFRNNISAQNEARRQFNATSAAANATTA